MKCAVHQDAEAVGYCRNCGKALCTLCVRPVRDVLYCEDCLATLMAVPAGRSPAAPAAVAQSSAAAFASDLPSSAAPLATAPAQRLAPSHANPGLAFVLGFLFPGLGAVYNGQYNKALLQIVIFAALIVGLSNGEGAGFETTLALFLAGFIFYMAFDAMRVARERAAGTLAANADPLNDWSKDRPIGPIILIVIGVILLLNQFDWFPWYRFGQLWPIILIVVGVLLFRNRLAGRQ